MKCIYVHTHYVYNAYIQAYVCVEGGGVEAHACILLLSLVPLAAGSLRHGQLPSLLWFLPPRSESTPLHATYLHMYSASLGQLHDSVTETSGIASQSALYTYVVCTVCDFSLVCLLSFITPVNSLLLLSSHSPPNISSSHLAHTIIPPTSLPHSPAEILGQCAGPVLSL